MVVIYTQTPPDRRPTAAPTATDSHMNTGVDPLKSTFASPASAMSLLGSGTDLFDMLGMGTLAPLLTPKHELGAQSEENRVICAVLDDASQTRIKIGSARFCASSNAYHMLGGSLQIPESIKSEEDGLYRDAAGTYAVMMESEFTSYIAKQSQQSQRSQPATPPRTLAGPQEVPGQPAQPAAAAPPQPARLSPIEAPLSPLLPLPVASTRLPPIVSNPNKATVAEPETIGCGPGSDTKTVFVTGNFEGDSTRLDVVLQQSRPLAVKAAERGNRVIYAFMGNAMPGVHKPTSTDDGVDSFSRVLELCKRGIKLNDTHSVPAENIVTLSGARELAWLRLANPNSETREITASDDPNARAVMLRKGMLSDIGDGPRNSGMLAHISLVECLQPFATPDQIAVGMLLKLVSVTQFTMQAPGVVSLFAKRLMRQDRHDNASLSLLLDFVGNLNAKVEDGVSEVFGNGELTPVGIAIVPAAKAVVGEVISFAHNAALEYTRRSKLVHCVVSSDVLDGAGGLWLCPRGIDHGSMVGKLPVGVDHGTLRVKWRKEGPSGRVEWSRALNQGFRHFVKQFMDGTNAAACVEMYQAYAIMATDTSDRPLPLQGLAANAASTCSGITSTSSTPFGTVQRRILVKKPGQVAAKQSDLLKVLDQWTNINTDAYTPSTYWGVATWCGGTKKDIASPSFTANLTDKLEVLLWHVSITLASLLSARVKDGAVKDCGIASLSGILGPSVLLSSGSQKQVMRIASFTHDKLDTAFVVLLPDAFVRWSLDYYNYDIEHASGRDDPMLATEGFLALPDESCVPLGLPGMPAVDTEHIRSELGTRVWALPKKRSEKCITTFTSADYAAIKAMCNSEGPSRMLAIPGYTIFHTRQNSLDPFSGMQIGLASIPVRGYEARMTITADSMPSHDVFRVVAEPS